MSVLPEDLAALVAALDAGREVRLSFIGWAPSEVHPETHFTGTLVPVADSGRAFVNIGDRAALAAMLRDFAAALDSLRPFHESQEAAARAVGMQAWGGPGRCVYSRASPLPFGRCPRCSNAYAHAAHFDGEKFAGCEQCAAVP